MAKRKRRELAAHNPSWAREMVDRMTPAEIEYWCKRLGVVVEPARRSPIERMIDQACGVDAPADTTRGKG